MLVTVSKMMNSKGKVILLFCLLLSPGLVVWGQEIPQPVNRDLETWNSISFKYRFNKHIRLKLIEQVRLENVSTQLDRWINQAELQLRPSPDLEFDFAFRHSLNIDRNGNRQGIENYFRFHLDVTHNIEFGRWEFSNRVRLQRGDQIGIRKQDGDYPANAVRFKSAARHNLKRWKYDPVIAWELFYTRQTGELDWVSPFRFYFGTDWKTKKNQRMGIHYIWEREIALWNPRNTHILRLKYSFSKKSARMEKP